MLVAIAIAGVIGSWIGFLVGTILQSRRITKLQYKDFSDILLGRRKL